MARLAAFPAVFLGFLAGLLVFENHAVAQSRPFDLYVDAGNCSLSRASWMAIAQENPGFGWQLAFETQPGLSFAAAMALMDSVRISSSRFSSYCCPTTVYRDTQTGAMSIVLDSSLPPPPTQLPASTPGLCCEEAALFMGSDPLGCTVVSLGSVPGATVVIGPTGPVSPLGPVTIPTNPPVTVFGLSAALPAGTYIGCYLDPNSPYNLDGYLERSEENTPQRCVETCRAQGFAYAGVEYGLSCLCGNSYDGAGTADNCDMACTGDASQICGGYNANSVYATGL